jgi:hypothetical protein
MADIEMRDLDRPDIDLPADIQETDLNLPNVPIDVNEAKTELVKTSFVSDVRKHLKVTRNIDPSVYRGLSLDSAGSILFNHKRLTQKRGGALKLISVKTLLKNPDQRDFLRLIGYLTEPKSREMETVAPEQTAAIKSKADSFKVTEDWAKAEKDKAAGQLEITTDEEARRTLEESMQEFEQLEVQARRRYNEIAQNQFKRINTIINDETRSLGDRIREVFRRDGLTIGALITAIGMTISTILLAIFPKGAPPTTPQKGPNVVKQTLVKVANLLLGLAKKALSALPGVIGSIVSFILKKTGELVLFLSQHLIVLFLALVLGVFEIIVSRVRARRGH